MRAALYTRISMDRTGESLGVQRQSDDCRNLADQLGWTVAYVFTDNDRSATSGKVRPGFEALLDAMKRGEVDAVVAWHPDRLYRKLGDLSRLMDVAKGVEFRTVTAGELDLSTPTGRMVASIMGAVATAEVEHSGDRKRRAAQQLAERGIPKWREAFGYVDAGGDRRELDPVAAPLIREAYAAVIAGASLADVCKLWNGAGALTLRGKLWTPGQVTTFLRKPRNAGLRTYQAQRGPVSRDSIVGPGAWPAIVDEETFWAAMAVMDAPGRAPGKRTVRRYLLTGVLGCGKPDCGGHLAGNWQMHRDGSGHSIVYVCSRCRGVSVRAEHVEPLLYQLVAGRLAKPDAVNLLRAELHDQAEAEALRIEANALRAQLDQLGVDYAEGLLTARQVKTATEVIEAKLAAVENSQHDAARVRVFDGVPLGTAAAGAAVKALSPDRFRAVLGALVDITVAPVGKGYRASNGDRFDPERVQVVWR